MTEPLKNLYSRTLISSLSNDLKKAHPTFDSSQFQTHIFNADWEQKELKERMRHIAKTLHAFLPSSYAESIAILKEVAPACHGFEYMFFPDYVECYGLDEYDISILALEFFTPYSSSEFAVRPFIKKYPQQMMKQMSIWAESNNHHIRRLASEGCRPRLPWAMALPAFKKSPHAVMAILEKLKNDDSDYVRRSVANNLNDISKDHPQLLLNIAQAWLGENEHIDWVVKHGCRSLLKQGHPEILALFGFGKPTHVQIQDFQLQNAVHMGDSLGFSFTLQSNQLNNQVLGKLRLEYAIYFMKNNGSLSRKIFKISESDCATRRKKIQKQYSFKKISTRKYYAGKHELAIIVNGYELIKGSFVLQEISEN